MHKQLARAQELWVVLIVAVSVVILATVVASLFERVHPVSADEAPVTETTATVAANNTQVISPKGWDVTLTTPLAEELPALRYSTRAGDIVGLSSVDLEAFGPACSAGHGALGTLVRFPAGSFASVVRGDISEHYIVTIGNYDYAFRSPQSSCADTPGASAVINRELSGLFAALDTLAPLPLQ